jgi:uncharacterized protein (TIGR00730 family)
MKETQRAVVVYCASSSLVDKCYFEAAARLGELLAEKNIICINGAGKQGLMGALNDSVIRHGGTVKGIIPRFMVDAGWCHERLNETIITQTIHERKEHMARAADAVVALPGGVGTLEELAEIVTWKQLGLYGNPVIILNTNDYYRPLLSFFEKMIEEKFLKNTDRNMWIVASTPEEVMTLLANSSHWMPSGALDQQKVL